MINLKKKKILITGADGFLGKHLVKNLLEKRKIPRGNLFLSTVEKLDLRKRGNCQRAVENQADFKEILSLLYGLAYRYAGNLNQTYANNGRVILIDAVFLK